jgi:hypothetical protein
MSHDTPDLEKPPVVWGVLWALSERGGGIGGAPPVLLETGAGSFLERAARALRDAGATRILVLAPNPQGPVAALAARTGCEILPLPEGPLTPEAALSPLLSDLRMEAEAPTQLGLLLHDPLYPLVRPETFQALVRAGQEPGTPKGGWILPAEGPVPRFLPSTPPFPPDWGDPAEGGTPPPLRIPLEDPGAGIRVDTLPLYRKHFPGAFRKRFQKW